MAANGARLYIALYTDEDVDAELARQIRARGFDAISAYEAKTEGISDRLQFEYAVQHRYAILTHNAKHFDPLFKEFAEKGIDHFGLITSQQLYIGELLRRCIKMLESVTADEMINNFKNLGEFK